MADAELTWHDELAAWMGQRLTREEQEVATDLLAAVEETLERRTGQTFTEGGTVTDEPHDGTGEKNVRVDRPVSDLRAAGSVLKVGVDPANPVQTVDLTDPFEAALVEGTKRRRIHTRQVVLPRGTGNVHVTYEAESYLPEIARQAVLEVAAGIWQKKGSGWVASASLGRMMRYKVADVIEGSESWQEALEVLHTPALG